MREVLLVLDVRHHPGAHGKHGRLAAEEDGAIRHFLGQQVCDRDLRLVHLFEVPAVLEPVPEYRIVEIRGPVPLEIRLVHDLALHANGIEPVPVVHVGAVHLRRAVAVGELLCVRAVIRPGPVPWRHGQAGRIEHVLVEVHQPGGHVLGDHVDLPVHGNDAVVLLLQVDALFLRIGGEGLEHPRLHFRYDAIQGRLAEKVDLLAGGDHDVRLLVVRIGVIGPYQGLDLDLDARVLFFEIRDESRSVAYLRVGDIVRVGVPLENGRPFWRLTLPRSE